MWLQGDNFFPNPIFLWKCVVFYNFELLGVIARKRNLFSELNFAPPKHDDGTLATLHKETLVAAIISGLPPETQNMVKAWDIKNLTVENLELRLCGTSEDPVEINHVRAERSRGNYQRTINRPHVQCTHCKKFYHTVEKCWLLHPQLKKDIKQINSVETYDTLIYDSWLVDSGSQLNDTGDKTTLSNPTSTLLNATTADGNSSSFTTKGNATINGNSGVILLKDCYYKKNFKNIISVSKIVDQYNGVVTFNKEAGKIVFGDSTIINMHRFNGMWYVLHHQDAINALAIVTNEENVMKKFQLVHERIGHLNKKFIKQMNLLSPNEMKAVDAAFRNDLGNKYKCKCCLLGEFPKFPYQRNRDYKPGLGILGVF